MSALAVRGATFARLWPAVVGVCGAVYFAAQGQFTQAIAVLTGGLGLSQFLHQTQRPVQGQAGVTPSGFQG